MNETESERTQTPLFTGMNEEENNEDHHYPAEATRRSTDRNSYCTHQEESTRCPKLVLDRVP
jgi:hypothetical protein